MDEEGAAVLYISRRAAYPYSRIEGSLAAYLAAKAGVPIVPVGITGTGNVVEAWKRGRRPSLNMIIGSPLELPPIDLGSAERKSALWENSEMIMKAIAALLPGHYRGVYRS
jgi:1-acyl-sn-glycerol-3-phosphate acyltransferase